MIVGSHKVRQQSSILEVLLCSSLLSYSQIMTGTYSVKEDKTETGHQVTNSRYKSASKFTETTDQTQTSKHVLQNSNT